jgi:hypothetical protein
MRNRHRSVLVLALVIVASLCATGVADAHFLSPRTARKGAKLVAKDYAQSFADAGDTDVQYGVGKCSQRTAHRWVCKFYVQGADTGGSYLCRGFAIVRFVSASSSDVTAKSQSQKLSCVR